MTMESLSNGVSLHCDDCLDVLTEIAENSIDAVVSDPPYHLTSIVKRFSDMGPNDKKITKGRIDPFQRTAVGFMNQKWDGGDVAFRPETWAAVLRVLKPGGYLVACGGSRTYHRMACAIEDAGFEIRDTIAFLYGTGFPKSHNMGKKLDASEARCSCPAALRSMQDNVDSEELPNKSEQNVLSGMCGDECKYQNDRDTVTNEQAGDDPLLSMRRAKDFAARVDEEGAEELLLQSFVPSEGSVCSDSASSFTQRTRGMDGEEPSRLSTEDGRSAQSGVERRNNLSEETRQLCEREVHPLSTAFDFDGASGRLCNGASASHSGTGRAPADTGRMCAPSRSQSTQQRGDEFGTVAMQSEPQERGAWPTCRRCGKPIVPDGLGTALKPAMELICLARRPLSEKTVVQNVLKHGVGALNIDATRVMTEGQSRQAGRWPSNVAHDGSEEVVDTFPYDDELGSAARYFFSAKADSDDRLGSFHPTVKPVDLMQWLCRMVCPPGGTILDMFAGTGTTGEAAFREGFKAVLIERETDYCADIRRRMRLAMAGPDERQRESIKARGKTESPGPLFE